MRRLSIACLLLLFLGTSADAAVFVMPEDLELIRDADKIAQLLGPNGNQSHFPY